MFDVSSKKSQRPKKPSQYEPTFHPDTRREATEDHLNVIFDKTSMQFSVAQKARLAAATRSAIKIIKIAYEAAQDDFEDDLPRVSLWFGVHNREVCALVRHAVERIHNTMTDNQQFMTFYGKPTKEHDSGFDLFDTTMSSSDLSKVNRYNEDNNFDDDEMNFIGTFGTRYEHEKAKASQKGLKHVSGSRKEFGGEDFALPPALCTTPRCDFDVGVAETRFCAPPATHLFEHGAGGCVIYIEPEALALGVKLTALVQNIFHQMAYLLLGVNDPNARVGIGTKPVLQKNCLLKAIQSPEATLADGGNFGCFITSFGEPISRRGINTSRSFWPKEESKWEDDFDRQATGYSDDEADAMGNPHNDASWDPHNGYPGEAMVMKDNHFAAPPPVKSNKPPVERVIVTNKTFFEHMRDKMSRSNKN